MKRFSRSSCFTSWLAAGGVLLALVLSGCAFEPAEKPAPKKPAEPVKKIEAPVTVEMPAMPETKPETKPEEKPAKVEEKPAKTEEPPKPETKPETKPQEKPAKTEEAPKTEAKPETKPEEKPAKVEEKPAKTEEAPKTEAKPETKPEEKPAKVEEKPAKTEEAPKPEAKPETKTDDSAKGVSGEVPAAPKLSTLAPAADLEAQTKKYVADLGKATASEEAYKDLPEGKISRDASTVAVLALALGLHDQPSAYKDYAGAMIPAAQKLAAAADYESAKKAAADLKAAAEGEGKADGELKWVKLASMKALMEQVPLISTSLKRAVAKKAKQKDAQGLSAVLAVIAQGSMANVADTKKPEAAKQWFEFCAQMRDAAAAVNAGIHAKEIQSEEEPRMDKLQKTCEDCHAVFHPKEK
jgi:hypothetical protein